MFTVTKEFSFEAAHSLPHLPASHKCHQLHGHSYRVVLELSSEELDAFGFVVEYGELQPFGDLINNCLDHKNLNDVLPGPTTAELLAKWLFDRACAWWPAQVRAVRVHETAKTVCEYRRQD